MATTPTEPESTDYTSVQDRVAPGSESFTDVDDRTDTMHDTIDAWLDQLANGVDDAQTSEHFQQWLDVQSRFHDYSLNNTLLIYAQMPDATRIAGYNTWREEFDRHVQEGEQAIWIWAPITAAKCPDCGNSPSYHDSIDCEHDDTPPEEWSTGVVAFKPVPVFDVSQTDGDPLPELDTTTHGDPGDLLERVRAVAADRGLSFKIVPSGEWMHGDAAGIYQHSEEAIMVEAQSNDADEARIAVHELAHAVLHEPSLDENERPRRELEAEATAYVIARHYGLDAENSRFYLAAWADQGDEDVREALDRIQSTVTSLIECLNDTLELHP
jgi:antirestriction protein ArdC